MIVGCYTTHLYCDCPKCNQKVGPGEGFAEILGETLDETLAKARKVGWTFTGNGKKCYAPNHKP